jgi:nucleotide-binding universal stress UspA family protein
VETLKDDMKILVAYDGSSYSKKALDDTVEIAKRFSGSITVLNVYWDPTEEAHEEVVRTVEDIEVRDRGSLRILDDLEPELKEAGVKYELRSERSNRPPEVILRIAKDEGFDFIAIGCRGMGGAKAWLLGSVSQKVVSEADRPVLVAK